MALADFFDRLGTNIGNAPAESWFALAQNLAGTPTVGQGLAQGLAGFGQANQAAQKRKGLSAALESALGSLPESRRPMAEALLKSGNPEALMGGLAQSLFQPTPQEEAAQKVDVFNKTQGAQDEANRANQLKIAGMKQAQASAASAIDPADNQTLDYAATVYRTTGHIPPVGQGSAGTALRKAIIQRAAEQASAEGGGAIGDLATAADYGGTKAGLSALGRRSANIDTAAAEANRFGDLSLEASKKLPRGQFVPLTMAIQAVQSGTSSPELKSFVTYSQSLANAAAVVAGRGTPNEGLQRKYEAILRAADGPAAFEAAVAAIKKEAKAVHDSTQDVRKKMLGNITNKHDGDVADPLGIR